VAHSRTWHNFLLESLTGPDATKESRLQSLRDWSSGPSALASHPPRQEEHLIPLHVIAGAGGDSSCRMVSKPVPVSEFAMGNFEWK
jgi:aromatic ring-opening dioxygenase catalytic subunit (LigB family)